MKPILFVDIDGVVNVFGNLGASLISFEQQFIAAERYRIQVPEGVTEKLQRLDQLFQCVWATTWQDQANEQIGFRLGLPEWPFVEFADAAGVDWKLPFLQQWAEERRFAWIDDEISPALALSSDEQHLYLLTQPNRGLDEDAYQRLIQFAK